MVANFGSSVKNESVDFNNLISGSSSSSSSGNLVGAGLVLVAIGGGGYYFYTQNASFASKVDELIVKVKGYLPTSA
jgi:hypothetical protein